jgi:hypothetical protein
VAPLAEMMRGESADRPEAVPVLSSLSSLVLPLWSQMCSMSDCMVIVGVVPAVATVAKSSKGLSGAVVRAERGLETRRH